MAILLLAAFEGHDAVSKISEEKKDEILEDVLTQLGGGGLCMTSLFPTFRFRRF